MKIEVYNVTYFKTDGEQIDSTQIDEKSEQLAWELFSEFGHTKQEGDYIEFEPVSEEVDNEIHREDVLSVAKSLNFQPTGEQIQKVIDGFAEEADSDPSGNLELWIENLLYNLGVKKT